VHELTSNILLQNHFVGAPRPELDEAWNSLLRSTSSIPSNHLYIAYQPTPPDSYVRVSTPEYTRLRLNRSTLELADSSGHVLSLGAYHSLHCLKQVHKWIHRDSYPEELFGAKLEVRRWHIGTFYCT
jgi:Mycotoxin biosynthesis protein UstYa